MILDFSAICYLADIYKQKTNRGNIYFFKKIIEAYKGTHGKKKYLEVYIAKNPMLKACETQVESLVK